MENNLKNYIGKLIKKYIFGDLSDEEIRKKLYDGIYPYNYEDAQIANLIRIQEAINQPLGDSRYSNNDSVYTNRDDIIATYLRIPKEQRHKNVPKDMAKVEKSIYIPTKNAEGHTYYKILNLKPEEKEELIHEGLKLLRGQSALSEALSDYFNTHTVSRGIDNKGEYVSYYDYWDVNPFAGEYRGALGIAPSIPWYEVEIVSKYPLKVGFNKRWLHFSEPELKKLQNPNLDLSFGIGNPTHYYDRIYLDDFYNVPEQYRGTTYLPEVPVTAKRQSEGALNYLNLMNNGYRK